MEMEKLLNTKYVKVNKRAAPHLVVVDDDPLFVRVIARVAEALGIRVTTISSPAEAYRSLPNLQYDAALFDYDLGRVNGVQLSRFMNNSKPKTPVILVSNYAGLVSEDCPKSVVARLGKGVGADSIMKTVLSAMRPKEKTGEKS
jgi:CheY-like chemotaxis protein